MVRVRCSRFSPFAPSEWMFLSSPCLVSTAGRFRRVAKMRGTSYNPNMTTVEILDRVLDPFTECLTLQAAQKIADFRPDAETQARIRELAAKADVGELSDYERAEYQDYVEAFDLVAILKSKARSVLAKNGS
jgi:hypothetical protein